MTYDDLTDLIARGDPKEMAEALITLWGKVKFDGPKRKTPKREPPEYGTWLTPAKDAYEAEMGLASFPIGLAAKALSPLYRGGWTPETIGARLGFYIRTLKRRNETKFLSLHRFAQTFDEWQPDELAFPEDE